MERTDDFGRYVKVEVTTINKAVCLFFSRERIVFREAFTKEEAINLGNELIKQAEGIKDE